MLDSTPAPSPEPHHPSTRSRRSTRRGRVALGTAAALGVTALLPSASALGAAASGPLVTLAAASKSISITRFEGEPLFFFDVGVYAVTGASDVQVRTTRSSYAKAPVSDLVLTTNGRRTTKRLPDGLVTGFAGLTAFTTQTVKNKAGKTVSTTTQTWCPGAGEAARVRPDAKATSPYPQFCQGSPWALGGVVGQPAHWASSLAGFDFGFDPDQPPPELADGTYTVTTTISDAWRKVMGTPKSKASATVTVTVTSIPFPEEGGFAEPAAARSAAVAAAADQFPDEVPAHLLGRADGLLPRRASATGTDGPGFSAPRAESVPSGPGATALTAQSGSLSRTAAAADVPQGHKPDLRSLPAFGVEVIGDFEDPLSTREYLAFAATVWNAGPAPLVVDGYRTPGADRMDAYQFFYDSKGKQVGWTGTGELAYDPRTGHEHWHFLDFAKYELLTPAGKAVRSEKESFCLAPTDAVDLTVKGARYQPGSTGLGTACGSQQSLAIREILEPGWGDTYGQFLPGQSFDITDLPNGTYTIRVVANPDGNLVERSTTNNESLRTVILGGTKGARTVEVPPYQGLDIP